MKHYDVAIPVRDSHEVDDLTRALAVRLGVPRTRLMRAIIKIGAAYVSELTSREAFIERFPE